MLQLRRLGIDPTAFDAALRATSRSTRIGVDVCNADGKVLDTLTGRRSVVLDGALNVDADADVTRTLELTLLDPTRHLMFESSVQDGALWADRFVAVSYGVKLATAWADVPVFFGRLSSYARDGDAVSLSATGKEADHLAPAYLGTTLHVPEHTLVTTAIRRVLAASGETRLALGDPGTRRTADRVDLAPDDEPWLVARRLARAANRHLYFDGMGYARLRTFPGGHPSFVFDADVVTEGPGLTFEMGELRNVVRVTGRHRGVNEKLAPPRYTAVPPVADPLHPRRVGLELIEFVQDDHVRTLAEARELAERLLGQHLREAVTAEFSALPVPHLEEHDRIGLSAGGVDLVFDAKAWSLPLAGGSMSVGTTRYVRLRRRRNRR